MVYLAGKVILGLIVGFGFGYVLQRGRFCVNTAFRDVLFIRDATLLRAWALAVLVQAISVAVLREAGFFAVLDIPPFFWAANLTGGFLFGMGMVMAGGCASGTCYRVGEGMLGSLLAFLAFGFAAVVTDVGALSPLQRGLRATVVEVRDGPATLDRLIGVEPWVILAAIVLLTIPLLVRGSKAEYRSQGWSWQAAGVGIGLVGVAGWITSTATGRPFGLSITGPVRGWFRFLLEGEPAFLDWGAFMLAGLFLGAFLSARLHGELKLRLPKPGRLLQSLAGGAMMGFGAQLAGGCNIGHGFTGLATLSLGSLTTTAAIVLGGWTMVTIMFVRPAWLDQFPRWLSARRSAARTA